MSLTERYSRATRSSHLEMTVELADVDYLIAAGLVRESLATRLMRLRSEFDSISRERGMIPMLRGFHPAVEALRSHALTEATRQNIRLTADRITTIASQVLDLFLDPNCGMCDGRGFNGGYAGPRLRCTACRESGKRLAYWKNDEQEQLGRWLQAHLEGKTARALGEMRRFLSQREAG